jgi:hypothetical protein
MALMIRKAEEILERRELNDRLLKIIGHLVAAANDWPSPVLSIEQLENEISIHIKRTITKRGITDFLHHADPLSNAWQLESLAEILEVFDYFDDGSTLDDIIKALKIDN